jgi:hypothetical protein
LDGAGIAGKTPEAIACAIGLSPDEVSSLLTR